MDGGGTGIESGVGIVMIVPGGRASYCIYACVLHVLLYVERHG